MFVALLPLDRYYYAPGAHSRLPLPALGDLPPIGACSPWPSRCRCDGPKHVSESACRSCRRVAFLWREAERQRVADARSFFFELTHGGTP